MLSEKKMKSKDPIFLYLKSVYRNLTLFIFLTLFSFLFSYIYNSKSLTGNIFYKELKFSNSLFQISNLDPTFLYNKKNFSAGANDYNYLNFVRKFERDFNYFKFCKFDYEPNRKISIKIPGITEKGEIETFGLIKIYFSKLDEPKSEECIKKIFLSLKNKENEIYFDILKKIYFNDWIENENENTNTNQDLIIFKDKKELKIEDFDEPFTKLATYKFIQFSETVSVKILERLKAIENLELNFPSDNIDILFKDLKTVNKLKLDFTPIEIFKINTNLSEKTSRNFQSIFIFFALFNFLGIALIFINRNLIKLSFIK